MKVKGLKVRKLHSYQRSAISFQLKAISELCSRLKLAVAKREWAVGALVGDLQQSDLAGKPALKD